MREMGKNQNSIVVLRISPIFRWMIPLGAKDNHTKYEQEREQRRLGTGVASGIPRFKICQKWPKNALFLGSLGA